MVLHPPVAFNEVLVSHEAVLQRLELRFVHMFDDIRIDTNQHRPSGWALIDVALVKITRWVPEDGLLQCMVPMSLYYTEVTI